jgi:hypothetical protein
MIGRAETRYRRELWFLTAAIALVTVTDTVQRQLTRLRRRFHCWRAAMTEAGPRAKCRTI